MTSAVRGRPVLCCAGVGTAGSVLVAAGGRFTGALPPGDPDGVWGTPAPTLVPLGNALAYAGLVLLAAAWWRLGRLLRDGAALDGRRQWALLCCWALPLLPVPLMYSSDVYSYVAQGALAGRGMPVYALGPAALGGPLLAGIPAMWHHTPAPYGPLFIVVARTVVAVTGERHVVAAVLGIRAVAVLGLGLMAWSVRALAARSGAGTAGAWWAGVLNPLVLTHFVAGAHNDALMLGLTTAGLVAFRRGRWVLGTVVLTLAVLVKVPSVVALLCAAAVAVAERGSGRARARRAAGITAVFAGTLVAGVALCGQGWGWLPALRTPAQATTALSLSTDAGQLLAWGVELVSGHPASAAVPAARAAVMLLGLYGVAHWVRRAPRSGPEYATGMALLGVVACAPALQPWYPLWGAVPLAAVAWRLLYRPEAEAVMAVLLLSVMPSGLGPGRLDVLAACAGGLPVLAAVTVWLARERTTAGGPMPTEPRPRLPSAGG
ncbi:polyprenol phosphomannose-dependent alpha 1,6 mannosyltransferase MptB [Streptomyces gamaensis]|uniref:Polyprenol phosphomannose-dependent alpha 1,6 mannosyltransferase MptB n=1 Tax=Streptomyces gamaensis TaxID=1763542 RepID=A0ABW0YXU3_9ACTN